MRLRKQLKNILLAQMIFSNKRGLLFKLIKLNATQRSEVLQKTDHQGSIYSILAITQSLTIMHM